MSAPSKYVRDEAASSQAAPFQKPCSAEKKRGISASWKTPPEEVKFSITNSIVSSGVVQRLKTGCSPRPIRVMPAQ